MTPIEEAIQKRDELEKQIAKLIQQYEYETSLMVHSVDYHRIQIAGTYDNTCITSYEIYIAIGLPPKGWYHA